MKTQQIECWWGTPCGAGRFGQLVTQQQLANHLSYLGRVVGMIQKKDGYIRVQTLRGLLCIFYLDAVKTESNLLALQPR